jgi:hypothetical protein
MPQRRLDYYFVPSNPPFVPLRCSFIDLPLPVRKLIYSYAGLDQTFVDLNYTNLKVYPRGTYPDTRDCRKLDTKGWYELQKLDVDSEDVWEITDNSESLRQYGKSLWGNVYGQCQSMLLVSKQLHQEVEAFIYSGAVFRVCMGQPLALTRLLRMSNNALSKLSSLTIRLDVPRSIVWDDGWAYSPTPPEHIDLSTWQGRTILKSWTSIMDRLAQLITPGQLRLRVIFRAKTMDDAKTLIEPMMQLPLLKDCGVCAEICGQSCWWKLVSHESLL